MLYQDFIELIPYHVKYYFESKKLIVENSDYQPIFEGLVPKRFDKDKLFSAIADSRPDCIREHECFLFDDETSPVANEEGFSKSLFEEYEMRLGALIEFMRGVEPIFVVPQPPQN